MTTPVQKWTDEDWRAVFDERAGILEFDGQLPRATAEAIARGEVARMRREAEQPAKQGDAA